MNLNKQWQDFVYQTFFLRYRDELMCRGAAVLAICSCRRDRETLALRKKYALISSEIRSFICFTLACLPRPPLTSQFNKNATINGKCFTRATYDDESVAKILKLLERKSPRKSSESSRGSKLGVVCKVASLPVCFDGKILNAAISVSKRRVRPTRGGTDRRGALSLREGRRRRELALCTKCVISESRRIL